VGHTGQTDEISSWYCRTVFFLYHVWLSKLGFVNSILSILFIN